MVSYKQLRFASNKPYVVVNIIYSHLNSREILHSPLLTSGVLTEPVSGVPLFERREKVKHF